MMLQKNIAVMLLQYPIIDLMLQNTTTIRYLWDVFSRTWHLCYLQYDKCYNFTIKAFIERLQYNLKYLQHYAVCYCSFVSFQATSHSISTLTFNKIMSTRRERDT